MEIKQDFNFEDFKRECFSFAERTLKTIEEHGMQGEFMGFLDNYYADMDKVPTLGDINVLLWLDDNFVFEQLEIVKEDEDEE